MLTQQGKLLVDGEDAFLEYGIFVEQYGYKALIQMPPFKKLDSTEWPELDGEEVDLTAPVFDTRTLQIQFCITDIMLASDFFEMLSDMSYHVFEFRELGRSYKLRLVSNGSLSSNVKLGKLALSFADDFAPVTEKDAERLRELGKLDEYNIILNAQPYDERPAGFKQSGYELDDIDFSRFGIYVVGQSDDNIQKAPNVRNNLSTDAKQQPGIIYDGKYVIYRAKDVKLELFIHAPNIGIFWERWYALFTAIAQPDERRLYVERFVDEYQCYYKNCSVSKFEILANGHVWCEFSLTLTFTDARPIGSRHTLLATENHILVFTEDGVHAIEVIAKQNDVRQ